ncbi:MAG: Xanthine/uracil/thiamine/ascorbate permease family protein [Polyangiaceae bacterium]|jgi:hypothetical protein|nr:Xanthine/uracil/thiamine/ascorbate permease family protein [Polyangiaceae bacterium]
MRPHRALLPTILLAVSCADGESVQPPLNALEQSEPMGKCAAVLRRYEGATAEHVRECSALEYSTSPPVFGSHYPTWAAYQTYDFPVPLGYLVHDLEHGAVVLFYDCPEGCADEVAEAQAFIDSLPADPRCAAEVRVQVVLVPRPGLSSRWAASAWGRSLNADCFDSYIFGQFYADNIGRGPEDLCTQGVALASDPCR